MDYIVSFIYKNHFEQRIIKQHEKITIGSSAKDSIFCGDYKSAQITIRNEAVFEVKDKVDQAFTVGANPVGMHLVCREPLTVLYISKAQANLNQAIELPHNSAITVGRNPNCNITIRNRYVSSKHCVIGRENGIYYVEDSGSSNGTYVNAVKTSKSKIKSGDEVHIYNYTFKVDSGKILVLYAGNDVTVHSLPSSDTNQKEAIMLSGRSLYIGAHRGHRRRCRTRISSLPLRRQKGSDMKSSAVCSALLQARRLWLVAVCLWAARRPLPCLPQKPLC